VIGKKLTAEKLATTIKDLFKIFPKTKLSFTNRELAQAMWKKPTMLEEGLVREQLTGARHVLEDGKESETFIPVTDYYFLHFDDDNQPRNDLQARRSIAGFGYAQRTSGIRRLRPKYDGTNDRLSNLWVERLKRTACAAVSRFGGRVLIAHINRAMTQERAASHLTSATALLLPTNHAELRKLLPKGIKHDHVRITLNGRGKSLGDLNLE
jgi:hypothetical protein